MGSDHFLSAGFGRACLTRIESLLLPPPQQFNREKPYGKMLKQPVSFLGVPGTQMHVQTSKRLKKTEKRKKPHIIWRVGIFRKEL
ncbi:hypothetical protein CFP56_021269 [Quercus suber]|uniref:Uncharacterized protein n=1 Tax=Quercus suber TaxID=58331 RepID=A0AAW0KG39_QUESU